MITWSIWLSLTYFTEHNTLQVHPCCCKWQNFILFYGWAWTEEPGRLQSVGLQRVRHNLASKQQQQYSIYSIIYMYVYTHTHTHTHTRHIFIHSSVDGNLGCVHILAIINNAAVDIGVRVSFWISVLWIS